MSALTLAFARRQRLPALFDERDDNRHVALDALGHDVRIDDHSGANRGDDLCDAELCVNLRNDESAGLYDVFSRHVVAVANADARQDRHWRWQQ